MNHSLTSDHVQAKLGLVRQLFKVILDTALQYMAQAALVQLQYLNFLNLGMRQIFMGGDNGYYRRLLCIYQR